MLNISVRILLAAFACHPEQGSESGVGWKTACLLGEQYELLVLTHPRQKASIQQAQWDGKISPRVKFLFAGKDYQWHPNRLIARLQNWIEYKKWLAAASQEAPRLCKAYSIELIHHLTIGTWRLAPVLGPADIPVVWGPLGGAVLFPLRFLRGLSFSGAAFEVFRNLGTLLGRGGPAVTLSCHRAAAILCGNGPDAGFIKKIRGSGAGVYVLSSAHFSPQELERFQAAGSNKDFHAPLQAFAGGICIGSKGIRFALEALAVARQMGSRIQYTIASTGPELRHLQKSVMQLGLADQVRFHAGFHGRAYEEALGKSHLFLMPSFREGSPRTILEAMLAGAVPVVCAASAQGEIVDEKVGFSVSIRSRTELVQGMADAMVRLDRNRRLLQAMSKQAQMKIVRDFNSDRFLDRLSEIYHLAKAGYLPDARAG